MPRRLPFRVALIASTISALAACAPIEDTDTEPEVSASEPTASICEADGLPQDAELIRLGADGSLYVLGFQGELIRMHRAEGDTCVWEKDPSFGEGGSVTDVVDADIDDAGLLYALRSFTVDVLTPEGELLSSCSSGFGFSVGVDPAGITAYSVSLDAASLTQANFDGFGACEQGESSLPGPEGMTSPLATDGSRIFTARWMEAGFNEIDATTGELIATHGTEGGTSEGRIYAASDFTYTSEGLEIADFNARAFYLYDEDMIHVKTWAASAFETIIDDPTTVGPKGITSHPDFGRYGLARIYGGDEEVNTIYVLE